MKKASELTREKLISEMDIVHEDDISEILECIELGLPGLMRHDLYVRIEEAGYDIDN